MATRTGSADLPLHSGHVPHWLSTRMAALGRVIVEAVAHHYGRDEVLRRLADPFWFQSFGAVMGMDWHSSGVTTSVMSALKRGLQPVQSELGLYICGGRGRHSRRTPMELAQVGEWTGLDAGSLTRASRLVAKVDSAAVQDGFDLYLHAFVVSREARWCVVQQGMSASRREARRYHWLSENLESFLDSPHAAIEGRNQGQIVNLADARAAPSRQTGLALVQKGPDLAIAHLRRLRESRNTNLSLFAEEATSETKDQEPISQGAVCPHLRMPAHHDVRLSDVMLKRLHATLASAAERGPKDFPELLLTPGVGARTIASLALVAEVVYGTPARFSDPARFSFAHGGKDGHPFPVPLHVYDETIRVLKGAMARAKLGNSDRLAAIRRLDTQARALENLATGPDFATILDQERVCSSAYAGRTVFGAERLGWP
jgi:hypothetical protein